MDKTEWSKKLEQFDEIIALVPGLERKGKTMPYCSDNTYMFALFNKAGEVGFRLSKPDRTQFLEDFESRPYLSYGATMKDYVLIPESMVQDTKLAATYLEKAWDYVKSLPPQKDRKTKK